MFYIQYLTSLCERRSWSEPVFETARNRKGGFTCRVRVNNREYKSDATYPSEKLAMEKAAESAYMLCYNFSVNDGMFPGQRQGQAGVTQGLPIAIGTGRRQSRYTQEYTGVNAYGDSLSRNSSRSPRTVDGSDVEAAPASRKSSISSHGSHGSRGSHGSAHGFICMCGRGQVAQHSRCMYCLREAGWY